jgi:glycosyltransferase involved in cell wall biosynthesis
MKIGIDARLIYQTGVGRYIQNLLNELVKTDTSNNYVIYLGKDAYDDYKLPNGKWQKRIVDVRWHTLKEQFVMPFVFSKDKLDLVHIPYFNMPILYPGKMVVTIHDLTILHINTGKATTLPKLLYSLRRFGYFIILNIGLIQAKNIISVSETTKKDIIDNLKINPNKISVTYEGVDETLIKFRTEHSKPIFRYSYFLYVGNAYPHKNLELLVSAYAEYLNLNADKSVAWHLLLVGKDDFFYKRLRQLVKNQNLADKIHFFGPANDQTLANLYQNSGAFVFPSLIEGFGLPAIEAAAFGCPVICSDIPIFHEILKNYPIYFKPDSGKELAKILFNTGLTKNMRTKYVDMRFNWHTMTVKTLSIYSKVLENKV